MNALTRLVGRWSGEAHGHFPTIEPFRYRETLTIEQRDEDSLFYVQKAVRAMPSGAWAVSHWESGFIRLLDDGTLDLVSAQSGGRTEVLRGTVEVFGSQLVIEFVSTAIANDPRLTCSSRRWELDGDTLRYSMAMSTTSVAALTPHLTAVLVRN